MKKPDCAAGVACLTGNVEIDASELGGIKKALHLDADASDTEFCAAIKTN